MSKLTDELKEYLKVFNPHNFTSIGGGKVWVEYDPQQTGRMAVGHASGYNVHGVGFKVDPDGPWYNYGAAVFTPFHYKGDRHKARDEALKWASEQFGITEWVKAPWRETWVSRECYDRVMELLASAKKDGKQ